MSFLWNNFELQSPSSDDISATKRRFFKSFILRRTKNHYQIECRIDDGVWINSRCAIAAEMPFPWANSSSNITQEVVSLQSDVGFSNPLYCNAPKFNVKSNATLELELGLTPDAVSPSKSRSRQTYTNSEIDARQRQGSSSWMNFWWSNQERLAFLLEAMVYKDSTNHCS